MSAIVASKPPVEAAPTRRYPRWTISWGGPLAVAALGGWLRFADLGRPHALVFDETYYVKDALSLITFGAEHSAVNNADELLLQGGDWRTMGLFENEPSFIVHPPLGKWVIGSGEALFGATPFGWRFAVALLGTLSILILARSVLRMTGSGLWGTVAGLLLAIDGMAIVMSRTAVLDGILAFFVLAAFWALLVDRDKARSPGRVSRSWWRPWRLAAATFLGLACAVKWSGLWYLAALVLLTIAWEVGRRRRLGDGLVGSLLRDGLPTVLTMTGLAVVVYVASWAGWFLSDSGWDRGWAAGSGIAATLASLWHYHAEMWGFHNSLSATHSYQSPAAAWLIQARPTSFYYDASGAAASGCGSGSCAAEVIALGNPLIWWAGVLALLHQAWRWIGPRDWRAGAAVVGVLAGWAPWLFYWDRTIFAFYSIVFTPFLIMALTFSLMTITTNGAVSTESTNPRAERPRIVFVAAFLLLCVAVSWWFYPLWTGLPVDTSAWSLRMWIPTWI
ncbi:MAG: phospholipid carrier-dependent glycosyltransferase [Candidatus Nanopelagicales bacterium]|nr:phospholipid carrier-dependent glycosyltransferase [Candidatus Nanopelagicales bacterium]MDZ4249582.1 phospholipid carrier-dependent glycosyltransferase [Candidatus Nanopelagicales bacterium]